MNKFISGIEIPDNHELDITRSLQGAYIYGPNSIKDLYWFSPKVSEKEISILVHCVHEKPHFAFLNPRYNNLIRTIIQYFGKSRDCYAKFATHK